MSRSLNHIPMFIEIENGYSEIKKCGIVVDATAYVQFNSISVPIKVKKSDNKIKLKLRKSGSTKYYYRLTLDGAYY